MTNEHEPTVIERLAIHSWNTRHRDTGPSWANIGQQNAWAKDLEIDAMLAVMRELQNSIMKRDGRCHRSISEIIIEHECCAEA